MIVGRIKVHKNSRNRSKDSPLRGDSTKKRKIFIFWGPHSHAPLEEKFCTAKRTHMPVSQAKFDVNRCNESPMQGEKSDFWPVSTFKYRQLALRAILPVMTDMPTRDRRRTVPVQCCISLERAQLTDTFLRHMGMVSNLFYSRIIIIIITRGMCTLWRCRSTPSLPGITFRVTCSA